MKDKLKSNQYRCEMCKGIFEKDWTDEEAKAELKLDFGDIPLEECAQICDNCYQKVRPDKNPEVMVEYLQHQSERN